MKNLVAVLLVFCSTLSFAQDTIAVYSKPGLDRGVHLLKTKKANFIATGITTNAGTNEDGLILCYNADMKLTWDKSYGGNGYDFVWGITETKDNGYIVTGFTNSYGKGAFDCWILKLNNKGDTIWTRTFGGTGDDRAISVITVSGGYVVTGQTSSWGKGSNDVLLFKISDEGEILWHKTIGEAKSDRGFYVEEANNKDLIISGITENNINNDVDAFIIRTNANGEMIWNKTFGAKGADVAHSLMLKGKDIIMGGYREYTAGMHHPWVLRLDAAGNQVSENIINLESDVRIIGAYFSDDNEVIGTGYTRKTAASDWDAFFIKVDKQGKYKISVYPMPAENQGYGIAAYKKGSAVAVGHSYDTGNKSGDLIIMKWKYE